MLKRLQANPCYNQQQNYIPDHRQTCAKEKKKNLKMKTNLKMMAEIKKRRKRRARNIIPTLEKSNYLLLENANKILKAKFS